MTTKIFILRIEQSYLQETDIEVRWQETKNELEYAARKYFFEPKVTIDEIKVVQEITMNKKLVFVVQIEVENGLEDSVRKSFEDWKKRVEGAYLARVKVDEVKVQED